MKNFRKVLALILVVATLFSFAAMTSAKEYKDSDKISYDQAVEVLSAIGILNGYDDGSFKPTDNIAREEMAKMVAVLSNAGDDVSDLYASACKFADTKDRWSASYVAYCNETGIVAGRNASTFDPRGRVTGLETAKMLLCVLGFDATAQGYVGSTWKTNVLRDAKDFGLLDGFAADYDVAKAITREEAAQMMLNALEADIVIGTISGNLVNITNTIYIDEYGIRVSIADAEKYGWVVLTRNNVVISNTPLYTIYKGLTVNYAGMDCYGNPSVKWVYKNSKGTVVFEGVYPVSATYSYTEPVDFEDVLAEEIEISEKPAYDYDVNIYFNGRHILNDDLSDFSSKDLETQSGKSGNGVLTNIFVNDAGREIVITFKTTFIDEVEKVDRLTGTFTVNGQKYKNTFDFAKGDMILYWLCGEDADDLHDAKLAEPVTGVCTRTEVAKNDTRNDSKTTVDGKVYGYNRYLGNSIDPDLRVMNSTENKSDAKYDVYLDEYGYIMYWVRHTDAPEYVYAYGVEDTGFYTKLGVTNTAEVYKYTNDLVTFDAKYTEDVEVDHDAWFAIDGVGDDNDQLKGLLFRYELKDGVACWVASAVQPGPAAYLSEDGDVVFDNDGNGYRFYGDSTTKYMVRTWNYTKGEDEYNVYTAKELPSAMAGYKFNKAGARMATIQFFDTDVNGVRHLDYVFIDALYQKTAQRAFVYADYDYTISDSLFDDQLKDGEYVTYKAMINGEAAILAVTEGQIDQSNKNVIPHLYTANLEVIGLVDGTTPVYADVTGEKIDAGKSQRLYFSNDRVIVSKTGNEDDERNSYWITDETYAVVYDGRNAKKLNGVDAINDYFEAESVKSYEGWVVSDGADALEIYINVTVEWED